MHKFNIGCNLGEGGGGGGGGEGGRVGRQSVTFTNCNVFLHNTTYKLRTTVSSHVTLAASFLFSVR